MTFEEYQESARILDNFVSEGEISDEMQDRANRHQEDFQELENGLKQVIVGQEEAVEGVLSALMTDGNILLEGVPGLGKSLLVEALGRLVEDSGFNRIQFVPDMLPSDILGQRVYNQKKGEFYINKGPVFTDFLLADEINRAPPKTQAAMMEVMQEKKVSIEAETFEMEAPYLVLATQNPLEQKGTYPLPEAMIDRFYMKLDLQYPSSEDESRILRSNTISDRDLLEDVETEVSKQDIIDAQEFVREVHVSESVRDYIVRIITALRTDTDLKIDALKYLDYGPSPRASIWLVLGASSMAVRDGRPFVLPKDVKKVAKNILRHRVRLNYEANVKDISSDEVVEAVLGHVDAV